MELPNLNISPLSLLLHLPLYLLWHGREAQEAENAAVALGKEVANALESVHSVINDLQGQKGRLTTTDLHSLAASVAKEWQDEARPDSLSVSRPTHIIIATIQMSERFWEVSFSKSGTCIHEVCIPYHHVQEEDLIGIAAPKT